MEIYKIINCLKILIEELRCNDKKVDGLVIVGPEWGKEMCLQRGASMNINGIPCYCDFYSPYLAEIKLINGANIAILKKE